MNADGSPSKYDPANPDPLAGAFTAEWLMKQRPGERYTGTCLPPGGGTVEYADIAGMFEWLKGDNK